MMKIKVNRRRPTFGMELTYDELSNIHNQLNDAIGIIEMTKYPALHKLFLRSLDALVE